MYTGDIEDAPAPSPIHSFKTFISNGVIHVTAEPTRATKANMSRAPKVSPEAAAGNAENVVASSASAGVVIVGGGSGTFYAVDSLREVRDLFTTISAF